MQTEKTFIDDIKNMYKYGGMTMRLIFINAAIFILINALLVFGRLFGGDAEFFIKKLISIVFVLPTDLGVFIKQPWTLITSIFAHESFFHFIMNMLFLYFGGKTFEQFFDQKRLLYTYLLGGIAGGLFEMLADLLPTIETRFIIGASGACLAVLAAVAFYRPKLKVNLLGIIPVPIIAIILVFIVQDFFNLGRDDGTAHFAHLGGAVLGLISIQQIHSPTNVVNLAQKFGDWWIRLFSSNFSSSTRVKKPKVKSSSRVKTDEEYNVDSNHRQAQTDRILDKISKSGYDSLTKKEKDFLFRQSKK